MQQNLFFCPEILLLKINWKKWGVTRYILSKKFASYHFGTQKDPFWYPLGSNAVKISFGPNNLFVNIKCNKMMGHKIYFILKVCKLSFWYPKRPVLVPFRTNAATFVFCPEILLLKIKCKKMRGHMIYFIKKVCTLIFWYPKGPILVPFWTVVANISFGPQILRQNIKCKQKGSHGIFYHKSVQVAILVPKRTYFGTILDKCSKICFVSGNSYFIDKLQKNEGSHDIVYKKIASCHFGTQRDPFWYPKGPILVPKRTHFGTL